jgi:nitrogen fixation protein NifU and related proteins
MIMLNLYQEIIMDHYQNPRNKGLLENADFMHTQLNSSCGDEVTCTGIIKAQNIDQIAFSAKGCVICTASASLLSETVKNKSIDTLLALDKESIIAMLKMPLGPVRLMCGLLPLIALQKGLQTYTK